MSPGSLAAAASQAGFRFESPEQRPLRAHPPGAGGSGDDSNSHSQPPKTPARNPGRRQAPPAPVSIERNRSPLGRYEVRSEADSEVSSPTSQGRSQTTRSNVTSLTSIGSEMDRQIGQWAVRVSADAGGIDGKVAPRSPTEPASPYGLEQQQQADKEPPLDESEENGLKALDTISISEPRQSLMPLSAHDPGAGDGRGYSMILQYYLDSDARESMVI